MPPQAHCNYSDVLVLRGTCFNHSPQAQEKPKASLSKDVRMVRAVLCFVLVCYTSCVPAKPSRIRLHPWGSAASSAHYSELCPSDTIHLQRNVFGSGGEFSESCVWVSATWLLLTLMGVTLLETHALPWGLRSPLMCVDCSSISSKGESTPLPCLVKKKPGPLSTLTSTPLALCIYG